MLAKLAIPPGVWRNGTQYQAAGRWYDANLVRWRDGSLRPIGGWQQWGASDIAGIARGAHSWTDNSNNRWVAFGTAANLYVYDDSAALHTITPASGFTTGSVSASRQGGFGDGAYGSDPYGTGRPDVEAVTLASTWALDSWGQYLVGCMDGDGYIWEWQLNTASDAAQVANSPTSCLGLVVTEERFLFALGAGGDPRAIAWCDQGDNTTWTAAATNQAGDFNLETDGEIRCGIKVRGETLILTSTDLWRARYIGAPLVYSFTRVNSGCGSPGNRTAIAIGNRAVWIGNGGFYLYDGEVRRLRCDVWDHYQSTLSDLQASKIFGWHNADHSEAWWLYPSDDTNECDSYIVWNYAEDWWAFGSLARSCGVGRGTFSGPLLMGTDQTLYQHESGYSYDGATQFAESGPVEIGDGERRMHAVKLYPDEATLGSTTLTFKTREYPTATESSHGPYTMAEPTSVRFSGRQAVMRVIGSAGDWRFGEPRVEVKPGGKR